MHCDGACWLWKAVHVACCGREKRAAAKAKGRKNASSDEEYISEPDAPSGSEDGDGGARDPFFQHDDDPFSDPFFQVRLIRSLLELDLPRVQA